MLYYRLDELKTDEMGMDQEWEFLLRDLRESFKAERKSLV